MASKGWGLFLVMIGLLGFVLIGGLLRSHNEAVVKVSPQGSMVIMSREGADRTSGDTSSALKDGQPFSLSPQPLPDLSGSPLFSLPLQEEQLNDQAKVLKQAERADAADCDLYH